LFSFGAQSSDFFLIGIMQFSFLALSGSFRNGSLGASQITAN
jgi:hypothetical protein